jgi:hypothetical protein
MARPGVVSASDRLERPSRSAEIPTELPEENKAATPTQAAGNERRAEENRRAAGARLRGLEGAARTGNAGSNRRDARKERARRDERLPRRGGARCRRRRARQRPRSSIERRRGEAVGGRGCPLATEASWKRSCAQRRNSYARATVPLWRAAAPEPKYRQPHATGSVLRVARLRPLRLPDKARWSTPSGHD